MGYGEASGLYTTLIDVGPSRIYKTEDLAAGRTYYFSVRAYGPGGASEWARELVVPILGAPPPPSVTISPAAGLWDNHNEPGTGYSLDFKHGVLVVIVCSYTGAGAAQWYIASGPLVGATFTSRLDKFFGGPCVACAFTGWPAAAGSDGTITIVFSSATSATAYLPGGQVKEIRPVAF